MTVYIWKIYKGSLAFRWATWLALAGLLIWRLGYGNVSRGFWRSRKHWDWDYDFPSGKNVISPDAVILSVITPMAEVASVIIVAVVVTQVVGWIMERMGR